jgi:hypothetical protein
MKAGDLYAVGDDWVAVALRDAPNEQSCLSWIKSVKRSAIFHNNYTYLDHRCSPVVRRPVA